MSKSSFAQTNCPIAQALGQVGEWWTLLILRNAFCGMSRFDDFQRHLEISTNILTRRLQDLTRRGIVTRTPATDDGRSFEYRLTPKGVALYPILIALTEWGEQWAPNPKGRRLQLVERSTRIPIAGIRVESVDGRNLSPPDIDVAPGPAADEKTYSLMQFRQADLTPSPSPPAGLNRSTRKTSKGPRVFKVAVKITPPRRRVTR